MLVFTLPKATPEHARDAIVEFLQGEADSNQRSAKSRTTKRDAAQDMARCNAILNAISLLKDAAFLKEEAKAETKQA